MTINLTRPNISHPYTCIEVTQPKEGLKVVTLNRPESLNAISFAMVEDLEALFQELKFDSKTRVVILTGAGRGFCAGLDLKEMGEGVHYRSTELQDHGYTYDYVSPDLLTIDRTGDSDYVAMPGEVTKVDDKMRGWYVQKHMANIIELMRTCPQPIIAAVNGAAAGGGASFAMASDIRICVPKTKFILSYINIGMSAADMGASYLLPRLIGVARAAEIMYTGRTVIGEEAVQLGIFSRCVEPEQLMDVAMEYADCLLGKSEFGLIGTKEALNATMEGTSLFLQLGFENRTQYICSAMGNFTKGTEKFNSR